MAEKQSSEDAKNEPALAGEIGAKTARKLKARRHASPGVWFGLGMMGLVGWSVAIPTLLGAGIGYWLDKYHPGNHTWTLALLVCGLVIGCFAAGHWVAQEAKSIQEEQEQQDD